MPRSQVDGCEKCVDVNRRGPTLYDMARIMAGPSVNAVFAINLDGGGSSATVVNGTVVDRPTCTDIDVECERAVATILCVKQ